MLPPSGSVFEVYRGVDYVGRLQGDITVMRREERTQVEDLSREDDLKEDKLLG